ncbi:beta-ketoacyl-[acyl-carrier-protein] synthase family protein [Pseudomonas fluorescens]|jgi:3-oxoacyl-[acyl-carrier-protein] synthase II|uniref:beta-ketoacyl-[acyl-carrier-protein] synthase family protein n=1 Tax=Pseudomonas fluorescens TaxID=294 RepID=UPI002ACA7BA8|nr:beta-ketoacyl-[acyl-carrier-protein] synthase family protein [Pseudomonas fluorescens]MDZ5434581.1 beta-ketoacyl-[acyl-carrier-protein] synthase family protein [Pseudomonas fluorescens]
MNQQRVVISGFGCCTPLGDHYAAIEDALRNGRSGVRKIAKYDTATFKSHFAGIPESGNFAIQGELRRFSHDEFYTRKAMENLLASVPFDPAAVDKQRIGCFLGVDEPVVDIQQTVNLAYELNKVDGRFVNLDRALEKHFRVQDFIRYDPTNALRTVHKFVPFKGPASVHLGLCSASLQAIGTGYQAVRQGRVDAAIVGGISAKVSPEHYIGLESVDIIATDERLGPTVLSRPFDARRSGYLPAEGAVLFLVESLGACLKAGREPLMELVGFGTSTNASHIVKPAPDSAEMKLAMTRALNNAGLQAGDIGMVNAHGTSTILNDLHESAAICAVLGEQVPVTANKSMHGHMIAAAGAMETLNTLICLRSGFIPGTINLESKDPNCQANVSPFTLQRSVDYCLKNSFGMGGLAASMIFKRVG